MRVLWLSYLLIGTITCGPVGKEHGTNRAGTSSMWQPFSSGFSGTGVSPDLGSSSPLPSLPNPSSDKATELVAPQDALSSAGPGRYSSSLDVYSSPNMAEGNEFDGGYVTFRDERYNSPEVSRYGVAYAASHSTGYDGSAPYGGYGGGYSSSASVYVGDGSSGFVAAQDENWSSGSATSYGDENPEPVFSDVSDLEPVYSFSSRSRYQRGRAVFAQTRYTPGEPVPPIWPVSSDMSTQSSPAKAPTKGGF